MFVPTQGGSREADCCSAPKRRRQWLTDSDASYDLFGDKDLTHAERMTMRTDAPSTAIKSANGVATSTTIVTLDMCQGREDKVEAYVFPTDCHCLISASRRGFFRCSFSLPPSDKLCFTNPDGIQYICDVAMDCPMLTYMARVNASFGEVGP